MDHVVGELVRRGFEAQASYRTNAMNNIEPQPDKPVFKLPTWGIVLIGATIIVFAFVEVMIGYTYGHLVATLAMVESPTAAICEPIQAEDIDSNKNGARDPELLLVPQALITAKIRTIIKHLRARGGFWSRFRGISAWFVYHFLYARLTDTFSTLRVPVGLNALLAAVLLSGVRMVWTHIVISEPSSKFWLRRVPNWRAWKKVALPTAILNICEQVTVALPIGLVFALRLDRISDAQHWADLELSDRYIALLKMLVVCLAGLFSAVAIVVPATVALTRVHASLLPDEDESIVPFDRSFGGRVVPAIVGGSGVIGILDAWKTFDWNARVRLLKIYLKVIAMHMATIFVFVTVVAAQLHLIMGSELKAYVALVKGSMN